MKTDTSLEISSPILDYLHHLHKTYAELREGEVATNISELGIADRLRKATCAISAFDY